MEIVSENVKVCIRIKKGFFKYENIEVVKNLNYKIKQGEIVAVMGAASSGKSTLINLLSGKIKPKEGKIYIDNEVNYKKLRSVSEVINGFNLKKLISNDTVYNNLVMCGKKEGVNSFDIEKRIIDLRNVLELDKVINKKLSELDEVSKIKMSVAISMMKNPSIIYFDNALVGLNTITKNIILKLLKRINKEFKTTIVVASVDLMDIEKICKRVSVIQNGEIIIDGDFESVKEKYWKEKIVELTFNKTSNFPKGDFEIIEQSDYYLKIKIDFDKCDFASLIANFDVNTIVDINISNIPLVNL